MVTIPKEKFEFHTMHVLTLHASKSIFGQFFIMYELKILVLWCEDMLPS